MKQFIYILSLIISVILTSCEGLPNGGMDIDELSYGNVSVNMMVRNPQKIVGEEGETSADGSNEKLGVVGTFTVNPETNDILRANIPYNIYADESMDAVDDDNKLYLPSNGSPATIHAYYPYIPNITSSNTKFVVNDWNNQSNENYDLCVATPVPNVNNANPRAHLDFYHVFSRVEFNIQGRDGGTLSDEEMEGLSLSISNINTPVEYDVISNSINYPNPDTKLDLNLIVSPTGKKAYAIVPPEVEGVYHSAGRQLTLTMKDGKSFMTPIPDVYFKKGENHVWNLKIYPNYIAIEAIMDDEIPYGGVF